MTEVDKKSIILVVDDEPDITETYAMFLEIHGYEVLTASNPIEALQIVAQQRPDLVISDCMMPYMDGVEFSANLRAFSPAEPIPVILISGAPEFHDLDSPTYDLFMRKPVLFENLLPEIVRLLAR